MTLGLVLLLLCPQTSASEHVGCKRPDEPATRIIDVKTDYSEPWKANLSIHLDRIQLNDDSLVADLLAAGWAEFMEGKLGSWFNFLNDLAEGSGGASEWRGVLNQLRQAVQVAERNHQFMNIYGGQLLQPAVAATHWLHKASAEHLQLGDADADLLNNLRGLLRGMPEVLRSCPRGNLKTMGCACMMVSCKPSNSKGHGSLLALEIVAEKIVWPSPGAKLGTVSGWPPAPSVQGLFLSGEGILDRPQWWGKLFPEIQVFGLTLNGPMINSSALASLLDAWADTLLGLRLWFPERGTPIEARLLYPVCNMRNLRRLKLDGVVTGLPPCLGRVPLVDLSISGISLKGESAIPPELAGLGASLVNFVAFAQGGERECPEVAPSSWGTSSLGTLDGTVPHYFQHCRARPSWDPGPEHDDGSDSNWQCPWYGWVVRLDAPDAPWRHWGRIERFWVDANFIHGRFPEELVGAWPSLRSLDLYLNELEGTIPTTLGKLKNLNQLRLQRNRFEGKIPASLFSSQSLQVIDILGNSRLEGCLQPSPQGGSIVSIDVQGTSIDGLCVSPRSESTDL